METRATTIQSAAPVNSQIGTSFLQSKVTTRWNSEWEPRICIRPSLECLLLLLAVVLAFSSARAQEDIDLEGYTLVFEDNFDTLSVAETDDKGDATWYFGLRMGRRAPSPRAIG